MKMTKSQVGKLGALALNSNPEKKSAAAKKAVATVKANNPDFYSRIAKLGALKRREKNNGESINV
jgi:hypothetical protein